MDPLPPITPPAGPKPVWPAAADRHPSLPGYLERDLTVISSLLLVACILATVGLVFTSYKWSPRIDFTSFHAAARTALEGGNLYEFHREPGGPRGILPYPYPPLLASLLAPLAKLNLGWAYWIWIGINALSLGLTVWFVSRLLALLEVPRPLLITLVAALGSLVMLDANVYWGQVNLPVTAIVAGAVLALQRQRSVTAGVLVAVATGIKVLPAALVIWFLVRRDWRALGAFCLTLAAALMLVPALAGGLGWAWRMNLEWCGRFWQALVGGAQNFTLGTYVVHSKNGSLPAIFDRFFGGHGARPIVVKLSQASIDGLGLISRLTIAATTIASLAWLTPSRRRSPVVEPWLWPLAASALLLCGWLMNILLWDHHLVGLLIVLPVVAGAALDPRLSPRWRRPLWIGLMASTALVTGGWFDAARIWGLVTLGLLILWACILWALISVPPAAPPPLPKQLELPHT